MLFHGDTLDKTGGQIQVVGFYRSFCAVRVSGETGILAVDTTPRGGATGGDAGDISPPVGETGGDIPPGSAEKKKNPSDFPNFDSY